MRETLTLDLELTESADPSLTCLFCHTQGCQYEASYRREGTRTTVGVCSRCHEGLSVVRLDLSAEEHVDDFIQDHTADVYARYLFDYFRLPAVNQIDFRKFYEGKRLFCTHEGQRWRVTGASRFGDIFITRDFNRDAGYDRRVSVRSCTDWSPKS